jgi:hypothetical protein
VAVGWDRPDGGTRWQREKADGPLWVASLEMGPTGSEKGGMTGGPELGKEKMKKENGLNSNLKLILKLDLIQTIPSRTQKN